MEGISLKVGEGKHCFLHTSDIPKQESGLSDIDFSAILKLRPFSKMAAYIW